MEANEYKRYASRSDFFVDAIEFLEAKVKELEEAGAFDNPNWDSTKLGRVKNYLKEFRENSVLNDRVYRGAQLLEVAVKDWVVTAISEDTTLHELMIRALLDEAILGIPGATLATCYLSSNKYVTEEFIEDLIYVQSRFFSFDEWDDEHVAAVTECASLELSVFESEAIKKLYPDFEIAGKVGPKGRNMDNVTVPIRFPIASSVNTVKFSKQFIEKYYKIFDSYSRAIANDLINNIDVDEDF